jgi:hypothetical protein
VHVALGLRQGRQKEDRVTRCGWTEQEVRYDESNDSNSGDESNVWREDESGQVDW